MPNALFGTFNPFAEEIDGDWIVYADASTPKKHLGDVYLNGTSFYEVAGVDEVSEPPLRTEMIDNWTGTVDRIRDTEQTQLVWYAEVGADQTTIWANFGGADPNDELVEINVRRSVFYPTEHHLDYITVRGFELAQAATPWAPPTADQPGLIGPNWAKGWIIEDNVIHDAKCSAVSIGKEISTGHNFATLRRDKPGYQYQLESVFAARQIGWDREHIGSHIIRRNTIYDCGQNGIVGHLGCVFSTIEDNHIYNIAIKREFYGYEIGGIKLHAALDVIIRHNRIHDCTLGIWLDWQTQGTRVSRNLCYANNRDLFVEVSHGPVPGRSQRLGVPGVAGAVQPGRRVRQQPGLRHGLPRAGRGPTHPVPRSAQHPGGRLRRHPRWRRPLHRQHLPRWRPGPGLRTAIADEAAEPTTAPSATTGTRRRWRPTSRSWPIRPAATTNASRTSSSRSSSATTCTPPGPKHSRPRRGPSSSPATTSPPRSSTKAPRSTWNASCRPISTTSGSTPSAEPTSNASASSTPTSRNPTAPRSSWAPTWSGSTRLPTGSYPPGPISALASGSSRIRVW